MPPPTNTPPAASVRSARLPASLPYADTKSDSASRHRSQRRLESGGADVAGRSADRPASASHALPRMRQLMQVDQPRTAQHVLDRGPAVTLPQHPHQLVLARLARREVGVATLGRAGDGPAADAHELRFAQARCRPR